jgi:hypothetical protein
MYTAAKEAGPSRVPLKDFGSVPQSVKQKLSDIRLKIKEQFDTGNMRSAPLDGRQPRFVNTGPSAANSQRKERPEAVHFNYQVGATNEYKIYYPMFGGMPAYPQGIPMQPQQPLQAPPSMPVGMNTVAPIAYANVDGTVGYMMPPPGFNGFIQMPQPMM